MKTRTKVILGVIAAVVLIGPFAIPVSTSGTLTNKEAAALSWDGDSQFVTLQITAFTWLLRAIQLPTH